MDVEQLGSLNFANLVTCGHSLIICQRTTSLYSFNYFLYLFDQFFIQIYQYGIERHTFFAIMVLYQKN